MTINELAETISAIGQQRITHDNSLHSAISGLSDYDYSALCGMLETKGYKMLWDIFADIYEVYKI